MHKITAVYGGDVAHAVSSGSINEAVNARVSTATHPGRPVAPAVSNATESHRRWREGSRLASITRKHRPPVGTTFSFILNEQARISFTFAQSLVGRKVKAGCVRQTRRNRHKHRCKRKVSAGTLAFTGHAGLNKVIFQGRLSRSKKLKPGSYTVTITAVNAAGLTSRPRTLSFTIVT
jgi:hypothetical protein